MARRVLVTGGAGFIGSHIAEALLARGHEVAVLDDLSTGKREQVPRGAVFFELDITGSIDAAFVSFRPDAVCHQAAQVSVSASVEQPAADARTNVLGSINVLEACRRHGVRKVVYASSAAVYGMLDELPLREEMRCRPVSGYGASKYAVEHYLHMAGREWGTEWVVLRYANVYGPRQDPRGEAGVVAIFSQSLLEGRAPVIFGGGELTRDYIFVEDIAAANCLALEADLRGHDDPVFNASTMVATSTNRMFELLCEAYGSLLEPIRGPWRPGDVEHSRLDNRKLKAAIGWEPRVPLAEGIARTAEYFTARVKAR